MMVGDRGSWLVRPPFAFGLVAAGSLSLLAAARVRGQEAVVAGQISGAVTGGGSAVNRSTATFFYALGTPLAGGIRVTPECSTAYIVGPVLVLLGLLALSRRLQIRSVVAAAFASLTFLMVTNTARITFIAWAVYRFGRERGYWWSHLVIGSAFSVATIGIAFALLIRIAFSGSGAQGLSDR